MSPKFKFSNPIALCALLLATALGASGLLSCASPPPVNLTIPRAADIDVRGKNEIAVIGFNKHRDGSAVKTALEEKIGETEQFKIVGRGKASLHMKGKVEESFKKEITDSRGATCWTQESYTDEDGKSRLRKEEYFCTEHIRSARVRVALQVSVLDAKNGDVLVSRRPICEETKNTTSLYDPALEARERGKGKGIFGVISTVTSVLGSGSQRKSRSAAPGIDENAMYEGCLSDVGDQAIRTIASWEENVPVHFKEDSSVPEFQQARQMAEIGEWDDALKLYESVPNKSGLSPASLARAYLNLGYVHMYYTHEFSKAENSFKKGLGVARSDGEEDCSGRTPGKECFKARIKEAKERRDDKDKLDRQRGL